MNRVVVVSEQSRIHNSRFKLDKFRFYTDIGKNWFPNTVVH